MLYHADVALSDTWYFATLEGHESLNTSAGKKKHTILSLLFE